MSTPRAVFLFGAGASYGSDAHGTPPLSIGLFDGLRQFNPHGWGAIQGDLASRFRQDFEEAMTAVAPHALAPLQRAMAAYFFGFRPRPPSLYLELARRITRGDWSGAACSLNYERLFELSLLPNGIQPFVGDEMIGGRGLEVCLPHGCCHIFCDAVRGAAGRVVLNGRMVQTSGRVSVVADLKEHAARIAQDAFPPVMSYFEPRKPTTTGRSFIEGQRRRWKQLALSAETIAVVGVRVRPHDNHIWDPIGTTPARIIYCAGAGAATEYVAWAARTRPGNQDVVLNGVFRDEFDRICAEVGL